MKRFAQVRPSLDVHEKLRLSKNQFYSSGIALKSRKRSLQGHAEKPKPSVKNFFDEWSVSSNDKDRSYHVPLATKKSNEDQGKDPMTVTVPSSPPQTQRKTKTFYSPSACSREALSPTSSTTRENVAASSSSSDEKTPLLNPPTLSFEELSILLTRDGPKGHEREVNEGINYFRKQPQGLLFLVGPYGSGKEYVARRISEQLKLETLTFDTLETSEDNRAELKGLIGGATFSQYRKTSPQQQRLVMLQSIESFTSEAIADVVNVLQLMYPRQTRGSRKTPTLFPCHTPIIITCENNQLYNRSNLLAMTKQFKQSKVVRVNTYDHHFRTLGQWMCRRTELPLNTLDHLMSCCPNINALITMIAWEASAPSAAAAAPSTRTFNSTHTLTAGTVDQRNSNMFELVSSIVSGAFSSYDSFLRAVNTYDGRKPLNDLLFFSMKSRYPCDTLEALDCMSDLSSALADLDSFHVEPFQDVWNGKIYHWSHHPKIIRKRNQRVAVEYTQSSYIPLTPLSNTELERASMVCSISQTLEERTLSEMTLPENERTHSQDTLLHERQRYHPYDIIGSTYVTCEGCSVSCSRCDHVFCQLCNGHDCSRPVVLEEGPGHYVPLGIYRSFQKDVTCITTKRLRNGRTKTTTSNKSKKEKPAVRKGDRREDLITGLKRLKPWFVEAPSKTL